MSRVVSSANMRGFLHEGSSSFVAHAFGLVMLAWLLSACGVQITTGVHARSPRAALAESSAVAGRWVRTRSDGVYVGSDLVFRGPFDAPSALRQVLSGAGYRFLLRPFSLELGAELGVGQPVFVHRDDAGFGGGTGIYVGAASSLLLRVHGNQDHEVGYAPAAVLVDLVLSARGGAWAPPHPHAAEVAEAGLQLGVRLTALSDIVVSTNKNWAPP